jgi:D-threo-aldose 1-dehydrogenase
MRRWGAVLEAGLAFFNTSPCYSRGLSEGRMGRGLRGRPRGDFTISTKVGRADAR